MYYSTQNNIDSYIRRRIDDQIKWYSNKSMHYQKWYKYHKKTQIILSASIPFLISLLEYNKLVPYIIGFIGVILTISEGFLTVSKHHENWIEYRRISETLKHEKNMFENKAGVYNQTSADTPATLFVTRCESIISQENLNWAALHLNEDSKKGGV